MATNDLRLCEPWPRGSRVSRVGRPRLPSGQGSAATDAQSCCYKPVRIWDITKHIAGAKLSGYVLLKMLRFPTTSYRYGQLLVSLKLNQMVPEPGNEILALHISSSNSQDEILLLINRCLDLISVKLKKYLHRRMPHTLIPVCKGMVLDERKTQCCCLFLQRRIEILLTKTHSGLSNRGFQPAKIAQPQNSSRSLYHLPMKRQDFTQCKISHQLNLR